LSENTLVIFTSDNGGMLNLGGRNAVRAGHRMNGDLLGFKFGAWEGGHRVPFIARWPGNIAPGTESKQLICNVDMLATFMALTGQDSPTLKDKDSVNILPALLGNPKENLRKDLVLAPSKRNLLSVRKGKWMYIPGRGSGGFRGSRPQDHAWGGAPAAAFVGSVNSDIENGRIRMDAPPAQLYDLDRDVNQTTNLYSQYPEVVQELESLLETYRPQAALKRKRKSRS
jgi:arylsulfatase A-like enzyme